MKKNRVLKSCYLVMRSDACRASDVCIDRRVNRKAAEKIVAEMNRNALAGNGGKAFRPNGTPVPLYYVLRNQEGVV